MSDVWIRFIFGIIDYSVKKFDLNAVAIVLVLILGAKGETDSRRTLIMNDGNIMPLFNSTISWILII